MKMRKYNLSKIMKEAWRKFREGYNENFGECLRYAWFCAKLEVSQKVRIGYTLNDWIWNKIRNERCKGEWVVYTTFHAEDIIKETEKAVYVNMGVYNESTGSESIYTKKCWIPKSCITQYRF